MSEFGPREKDIFFQAPDTGGGSGSGSPVETQNHQQAIEENSTEFELTPEIEAMIMEKVQDVLSYGTAFTRMANFSNQDIENDLDMQKEKIQKILKNGLIPKNQWSTESVIYFNIIGRMRDIKDSDNPIEMSEYMYMKPGAVALIFNISEMQEMPPRAFRLQGIKDKKNIFFADIYNPEPDEIDESSGQLSVSISALGEPSPPSRHGFITPDKIMPNKFNGIVIDKSRKIPGSDVEWKELVKSIEIESYTKQPSNLVPIYDIEGNLLWPRQMSYEEVKQFVAEREGRKKQDAEGKKEI